MQQLVPPTDPVLRAAWLERAPADLAVAWISSVHVDPERFDLSSRSSAFGEALLRRLLDRRDAFIDIAIALYADHRSVLHDLWQRTDPALRRAILRNENRGPLLCNDSRLYARILTTQESERFVNEADLDDFEVFATNPRTRHEELASIFERGALYQRLPDDRWRGMAVLALGNPNLHTKFKEERYPTDPIDWMKDSRPKKAAMRLLLTVPVSEDLAWALEEGLSKFSEFCLPIETPPEVLPKTGPRGNEAFANWRQNATQAFFEETIRRWTVPTEEAEKTETRYYLGPMNGFACLRMALGALAYPEVRAIDSHPDLWVRLGAASVKKFWTAQEVRDWFNREGWRFVDAVCRNPSLHRRLNTLAVSAIRNIVGSSDTMGFDWENIQHLRSRWAYMADHFHKMDPEEYYRWDEYLDVPEEDEAEKPEEAQQGVHTDPGDPGQMARGSSFSSRLLRAMKCLKGLGVAILFICGLSDSIMAGSLDDADAAHQRGDYAEAVQILRPLAEQGDPEAQYKLGIAYAIGQGVPQDFVASVKWYQKAAEQGHAAAQLHLGVRYEWGAGVPADDAEAVRWYLKAANQGHAEAQTHLGSMYHQGRGVPQDFHEASSWYLRAAEQGFARAQALLGVMYLEGEGVLQDYVIAHKWLNLAAAREVSWNRDAMVALRERAELLMTREQIAEAQKLARDWKLETD